MMKWVPPRGVTAGAFVLLGAFVGAVKIVWPGISAPLEPFALFAQRDDSAFAAGASLNAFGASREVRVRFGLPEQSIEFPVEVSGEPSLLAYAWVPARDTSADAEARPVNGASFILPSQPGFYNLAIIQGTVRTIITQPLIVVEVPFERKVGGRLNGYTIGTYLAERFGRHDHPAGFLEVGPQDVDLRVSAHLKLGDFITHDDQEDVWPKYVALEPRLLDKLELVLAKLGERGRLAHPIDASPAQDVAFDVHSGFRTPAHNRGVQRAAQDSRHQYGDAADVAIDADGDGRVTAKDDAIVAGVVEQVEAEHPDLVGGMGIYTSALYRTPYVHIDTRGQRSRWRG